MAVTVVQGNDPWAINDRVRRHGGRALHQASEQDIAQALGGTLFSGPEPIAAYLDPQTDVARAAEIAAQSACDVLLVVARAPSAKKLPSGVRLQSLNLPDRRSAGTWLQTTAQAHGVVLTPADIARLTPVAVRDPRSVVNSFRIAEMSGMTTLPSLPADASSTPWAILDKVARGRRAAIAPLLSENALLVPTAAYAEAALRRAWQVSRSRPSSRGEAAQIWGVPDFQARLPWTILCSVPEESLQPLAQEAIAATMHAKRSDPVPLALLLSRLASHFATAGT